MSSFRFFGDISWFSERKTARSYKGVSHALYSHLRYIGNEHREDLVYKEGIEWKKWKRICDEETSKRWDARVAGKFVIALPNNLSKEQAVKFIKEFVENEIQPADYGFALHKNEGKISNKKNFHAHIVFSARGRNGKKLRLGRKELRRLQKKYDELLEKYGFKVERNQIKHVRVSQYDVVYNPEAVKNLREAIREVRKLIQEAQQEVQKIKEEVKQMSDEKGKKLRELKQIYIHTAAQVKKFIDVALAKGYSFDDIKEFFVKERKASEEKAQKIILTYQERQARKNKRIEDKYDSRIHEIAEKLLRAKQEQERKKINRFHKKFRR